MKRKHCPVDHDESFFFLFMLTKSLSLTLSKRSREYFLGYHVLMQFACRTAQHEQIIRRVRYPRHLSRDGLVRPYITHEAMGFYILNVINFNCTPNF